MQKAETPDGAKGAALVAFVVVATFASGCPKSDPSTEGTATSAAPSATHAAAATATSSASVSIVVPPLPQISRPEGLEHAVFAELTDDGWIALVKRDASDDAKSAPLTLVTSKAGAATPKREELPFSIAGDLKGGRRLVARDLRARRFVVAADDAVSLWDDGKLGDPVKGTFPLIGAVAVSKTQAIAVTGRMDRRGFVDRANGTKAFRHLGNEWTAHELPGPPEKDWSSCFWDATARPGGDEIVLLQICAAPKREMAYAVFRLTSTSDGPERIPFDNGVFDPVRAARGAFEVEDDGTIDLGSQVGGVDGKMTLARLRGGREPWVVMTLNMPTRLASSVGVSGDHLLFTDGGPAVRESSDGGRTFREEPPLTEGLGMLTGCNAIGCGFQAFGPGGAAAPWTFRRWAR